MTTLYAQSTGNWDAINWNTAANGSGSNQTPAAADTLVSNSYTVTVNGNYTVTQVTNTSGGTFSLANGVTLTCTDGTAGVLGAYASVGAVTFALAAGSSATLAAKVAGSASVSGAYGVHVSGAGTLTITGNVSGGNQAGGTSYGIFYAAAATVTITGNLTGINSPGIFLDNAANGFNLTITGNLSGTTASSIKQTGSTCAGSITITGNLSSSSYACISLVSAVATSITGSVTTTSPAANQQCVLGTHASATTRIVGALTPSSTTSAISTTGLVVLTGPMYANSSSGKHAVEKPDWRWDVNNQVATSFQAALSDLSGMRTIYSADSVGGNPSAADVRSGTIFGPASELTGTLAVPPAASVAYGVPVDATTGTAAITAATISAAVWDTLVADLDTANSIGARLAQAATVPSTGAQIAALGV